MWLGNGLFAKVLGGVPRHEEIVARILGATYAAELTLLIGLAECVMVVWVLSRWRPGLCALTQACVVMLMNVLEFVWVPELLLWGRWNIVFAALFCAVVLATEFGLRRKAFDPRAWKQHPFAVEARFERSVVLTHALEPARLRPLVPDCLELDTFTDREGHVWAFLAVAMVRTRELRPAGLPRLLGRDFSLLGYRAFVRYRDSRGRRLRGLYILRSETDRRSMVWAGNLFTRYDYHLTDVDWVVSDRRTRIRSKASRLAVQVIEPSTEESVELPAASPFADWREARRFAGPMPFTFSLQPGGRWMVIIEGVREDWNPRPLLVEQDEVGFLAESGLQDARLANAFLVTDIPYRWEKGRRDPVPAFPAGAPADPC